MAVATACLAGLAGGQEPSSNLAFVPNDKGEYTFDTGVLRGTLRAGGKSLGLSSVVHVPSGTRLDRSMGLLSHYRVFTTGQRYGAGGWDWPSTARLLPDGAVQVTWPAADRPFEMGALYRWKDPQTIDVETTVTARRDVSGFEVFLASYFAQSFASPFVYVGGHTETHDRPGLLLARRSFGDWQMFPRDAQIVPLIHDGRWKIEPHPVDWAIMPRLAAPLCLRRTTADGLTAILMAPPTDCFAISTPYEGETHYSLYLSLFGRDLKAGQTAKARARLAIAAGIPDEQIIAFYRQYRKEHP
ncbi:MAG: hypothetical protein FJ280_19340 [Planctomycetes bacterium]|nr:hypothetical protein [Planctomycetota bacterium]